MEIKNLLIESGLTIVDEKIVFPSWCEGVAIDVGLSSNAPQSAKWIARDRSLCVIGFEPIPENVISIKNGTSVWPEKLPVEDVGNRVFIVQAALGNPDQPHKILMHQTKEDSGCSSILEPKEFEVDKKVEVLEISLASILEYFPWQIFPSIQYLKTDCQGYDFHVIQGCKSYLSRIQAVTCEIDTQRYVEPSGTLNQFKIHFEQHGFSFINRVTRKLFNKLGFLSNIHVDDPTWIKFDLPKFGKKSPKIYQRG